MSQKFFRTQNNVFLLETVSVPVPTVEPEVTHHIFVGDRSGSMWGDVEGYKNTMKQVLAVEDITNEGVETSLISFSSHKDVTLHWSGVPVSEVNDLSNPYMGEIDSIRATFLTGISQGLYLALEQVKPGQTTGITLFTDGYANDPSSSAENKALDAFVQKVQAEYPNVFVNCIGYRDWCDWPRMEAIANALSGRCVKAKSFKTVLEAMKDTQALLAGNLRPALKVSGEEGKILMAVNRTTGQVNAANLGESLSLRGVGEDDEVSILRIAKGERIKNTPKGTPALEKDSMFLAGAMARAYLSLGAMRTAKEVLFSTGNKTLWVEHQSAMTPSSLAALNEDLTQWVVSGNNEAYDIGRNTRPPHNLFDLAEAINSLPPKSLGIDKDSFYSNYRRRSVKRVPGKRNEDGSLTPPNAELVPRKNARTYVKTLEFNKSDASVQISTETASWVKRLSDGEVLEEVNFVSLDALRDFRSYTLVSSGERNVEVLPLEVYTERAWNALTPFMLPHQVRTFKPGQKAKIALKKFRMDSDTCMSPEDISEAITVRNVATAKVKLLSAMQDKDAASPFTSDQVAALREVHLTPALYFSAPSTYHYVNKEEATKKGQIDSYTRYKVNFGNLGILTPSDFRSGNAFLARRYNVTLEGAKVSKPTLDSYLGGAEYSAKVAKDTEADKIMAEVADNYLLTGDRMDNAGITRKLKEAKGQVEAANEAFRSLVMEIGCTGLLPAELEEAAARYEPEAFAAQYGIKLKKAQKEGIFYVLPGEVVISVTPETSWYTVSISTEAEAAAK